MLGCRMCLGFLLLILNTSQALDVDTSKFEKLVVLPRSNKISSVEQAADGDTATCIQYRRPRKNARVWIDLRGLHNVHRVIVRHSGIDSNSDLQMMKNIQIKLSDTTSASNKKNCFTNYDDIPSDGAMDTNTSCVLQSARSVYVIRPTELRFCEVEVYGCVSGRWGAACEHTCGACAAGDTCDSVTGNCPGECAKGWNGYLCNIATLTTTATTITPIITSPPTTKTTTTTTTMTSPTTAKSKTSSSTTTTTPIITSPPTTKTTTTMTSPTTAKSKRSSSTTTTTTTIATAHLTTKVPKINMTSLPKTSTITVNTTVATTDTNISQDMLSSSPPDAATTVSAVTSAISGQTEHTSGMTSTVPKQTSGSFLFVTEDERTTQSTSTIDGSRLNMSSSFPSTFSSVTSGNTQVGSTSDTRAIMTSPTDVSDVQTTGSNKVNESTSMFLDVSHSTTEESTNVIDIDGYTEETATSYDEASEDFNSSHIQNVTSNPNVFWNTLDDDSGTTLMLSSPVEESSSPTTTMDVDWSGDGTDESRNDSLVTTQDLDSVTSEMHISEIVTENVWSFTVTEVSSTVFFSDDVTKSSQVVREVELTAPNGKETSGMDCEGFSCSKNYLVVLIAVVVALLLFSTLIITVYMYRRRVRQKRSHDFEKGDSFKGFNGLPLPDIAAAAKTYGSNGDITTTKVDDTEDKDDCDFNTSLLASCNLSSFSPSQAKSTPVGDIQDHLTIMKDRALFNKNFMSLSGADISPCSIGTSNENSRKNRYVNITTFDHSRVALTSNDEEENYYINASYIDSFEQPKAYIATQGPLKHTVGDFWRMIWKERSEKIVMLTELQENEKIKCVQYWPDENKKMSVDNLTITMENEYHFPVYKLRSFYITDSQSQESRKVTQFQFTAWPDHGVPEAFPLIMFHDRVTSQHSDMTGPMVVHCSAGVGRTGTFIAIDALSEQGRKTGHVTIHLFVEYMRRCRPRMVQTLNQYVFLHYTLMEMFLSPESLVKAENLREKWKINSNGVNKHTNQERFKRLQQLRLRYGGEAYSAAHQEHNSRRNGTTVLPVDDYRVKLDDGEEDYINAVTLPNLGSKPDYIVTEIPLSSTTEQFWQMIHEQECNVIVCLDHPLDEPGVYVLPGTEQEKTYGAFSVRHKDTVLGPHDIERKAYILTRDKEENEVAVFYLSTWNTEDQLPPTCASLISLHQETQKWQEDRGHSRVTVVCRDGAERCGLYCAVCNIVECIDWYNRVDIFRSVRHLQIRRPEVIQSQVQYSYCFDVAVAYTDTSDGTCIKLPDDTIVVSPTTLV
ncbi:Receptor-type tyrosine-protein phosphatase alpha [Mizuhopecten yessoensis]|uniref:protein-tyrosine-phosphatase n=1 Tax=Mizuhopecten yessoensis TaxID=6573 RepID=A0A210QAI7_MIZYE|nr:Receptor-type tyrosine-protein phosphatase alpha [Mizuhopecten yessoensis]